jgi:LmbE family N-acetylglucosaminyl deacetylase
MRKILPTLFVALLALALATAPVLGNPAITVVPGKTGYQRGESLSVSGSAAASKAVSIQLFNPAGTRIAIAQVTSAADGTYSKASIYAFSATDALGTYTVKVYCSGESAEATFSVVVTDAVAPAIASVALSKTVAKGGAAITVTVTASDNVGVTSVTAGSVSLSLASGTAASGTWSGSIAAAAAAGAQSIAVVAYDAAGNNVASSAAYTVDNTAPVLTVTAPTDGAAFHVNVITVSGSVTDAVSSASKLSVTVNNVAATVAADGSFSKSVTLSSGLNAITVAASDEAGNVATVTVTASYTVPVGKVDVSVAVGALYFAGEQATVWVATAYNGEAVASTVSGYVVLPNGANASLTFTAVGTGVCKAGYTVPAGAGSYAAVASADYQGVKGIGLTSFLVSSGLADLKSDVTSIKGTVVSINGNVVTIVTDTGVVKADVSKLKTDVSGVNGAVSTITTPVWAAVILSLIAAIAAIVAVVSIRSKIAG